MHLDGEGISSADPGRSLGRSLPRPSSQPRGQEVGVEAGVAPGPGSPVAGLCQGGQALLAWLPRAGLGSRPGFGQLLRSGLHRLRPDTQGGALPTLFCGAWILPSPGQGPRPAPLPPAPFPAPPDPGPAVSAEGGRADGLHLGGRSWASAGPAAGRGWEEQASRPRQRSGGISELPTGWRPEGGAGLGWPGWRGSEQPSPGSGLTCGLLPTHSLPAHLHGSLLLWRLQPQGVTS